MMKKLHFIFFMVSTLLLGCHYFDVFSPKKSKKSKTGSLKTATKKPEKAPKNLLSVHKADLSNGPFVVPPLESNRIQIASFNIQVFGPSILEDKQQVKTLKKIVRSFDLVAIQEVKNKKSDHLAVFLKKINEGETLQYTGLISPRAGRSAAKEQFIYLWDPKKVTYQKNSARFLEDPEDDFEREPFIATFKSGNFDFIIMNIHIKPDEAHYEINSLATLLEKFCKTTKEKDFLIVGDFNADGSYFDESSLTLAFPGWIQLITNEMDTMVRTDWTYDRIMIQQSTLHEYVKGSGQPWHWYKVLGEKNLDYVFKVSDHYPVMAQFNINLKDDD